MNTKPVIVIYCRSNVNQQEIEEFRGHFSKSKISDEYWVMIFNDDREETKVEVFNVKDVSEIEVKELESRIIKMLESGQTKV